ncbi:hypothetical protein HTZ84_08295 [Haloterrigena sp. SYSU A558-1]|uniref:Uncharacterized protein n=1 Tax=Haloterrigena gelatinilytica TaxID=2741724 RepID=A0A8J8GQU5_9EURY|nr:hypothetical protein [Haloterrigena gelatinilytica]NUB91865.1 hypothetical protein [Haloterrigena gelatinilytica]NUC72310.1 hypothetical protein [Haloterrigena gelatinilytica]
MSQATLSGRPHTNSDLVSGHYLNERIQGREERERSDAAREAMNELQSPVELESGLVEEIKIIEVAVGE